MRDDALALAAAIRERKTTAVDVMEASIKVAHQNIGFGALTVFEPQVGRDAARLADAKVGSDVEASAFGAFYGVPSLVKDLGGPFAGWPVTCGSRAVKPVDVQSDSDFAARLRQTGLCFFGMTSVPEFGLSLSTESSLGGPCRNPLAPDLTAGGSSGGAAAAVAHGSVAIAHATDAGGSIRVPAACCGLVGLKAGRDTVPGGPDFTNYISGLASELAVCRSVRDCAAVLSAAQGRAPRPEAALAYQPQNIDGTRIGVISDTGDVLVTDQARSAVIYEACDAMAAKGVVRMDLRWSDIERLCQESAKAFSTIICANLANMVETNGLDPSQTELITQTALERGFTLTARELISAQDQLITIAYQLLQIFEKVDCIILPMLSAAPKAIGFFPMDHQDLDDHFERMFAFAPTAALANASGFPAITLPFGADDHGLPLPVQMIAPSGGEALLLSLAAHLEAQGRWTHRFPVAGLPQ